MKKGILVVGAGGHASVCVEVLKDNSEQVAYCVDVAHSGEIGKKIHDVEIVSEVELKRMFNAGFRKAVIAIGDNSKRSSQQKFLSNLGFSFENALSRSAKISKSAQIGMGVVIMPGAIINSKATIGNHSIVNSGAVVEHDCKISDFVHIGPNCTLTGNVKIGSGTLIGAGTVIIPEISVGSDVIIGAGSVVVKNIDSYVKAYGNPAELKKLQK
jgi:UDP-perosamine 4-acetyltransferase